MPRLRALIVLLLLKPQRTTRAALVAIAIFAVAGLPVLIGLKLGQNLFMDSAEGFSWGQHFLAGYGRHPPLTGWIAGGWYLIFPAENWSSYALSRVICGICLTGVYFVARRVLDRRRALFVVLIMFFYPLLLGAKADRYNNYQVLQAIIPLVVLCFLLAWQKRTAFSGALLGLAGAAATLTIYSGFFGVVAIGLAALLHPHRGRFFMSPAPYAAIAVFLLAVSPHLVWLYQHNFASLRFASGYVGRGGGMLPPDWEYIENQVGLIAIPLLFALMALWRWRRLRRQPLRPDDGLSMLLAIVVAVLVTGPVLAFMVLSVIPSGEWGNPFFTLVPVVIFSLASGIAVPRRAVANIAIAGSATIAIYLIVASIYPWANFRTRPNYPPYQPIPELAQRLTAAWHDRMKSPLPIVVSDLQLTSYVAFYSSDHPRPIPDFSPYQAPWLDHPAELHELGYVGICRSADQACFAMLQRFDPQIVLADRVQLFAVRRFAGAVSAPYGWDVWLVPPRAESPLPRPSAP